MAEKPEEFRRLYEGNGDSLIIIALAVIAFAIFLFITAALDLSFPFWVYIAVPALLLIIVVLAIYFGSVKKTEGKVAGAGKGWIKTIVGIVLLFGILIAVIIIGWYFFGPADRIYTPQYLQSKCPGCQYTGNYISVSGQNKLQIPASEFTGGEFGGMKVVAETKSYFISIGNNIDVIKIGYKEIMEGDKPYHYVGIIKANIIIGGEDSFSVPLEKAIATYEKSRFEISIQRGPEVFFPFYANPRNPTVYINGFQAVEGDGLGKAIKGDIVIFSPKTETKIFRVEIYDTSFAVRMGSLLCFIKSLAGIS